MLLVSDISVKYGENFVLQNLNMELEAGKVHGLMGINGAGKTTLLNTIYGLIKPESGKILWKDEKATNKHIGYLETDNFFYSLITGEEYLRIFRSQHKDFDIERWREVFDLPLKRLVRDYSTGMKKKLALLGIISLERPVMILDEPFNGLDLESNHLLKNIIRLLAENGRTVLVTSHILESLTGVADTIHYLAEKRIFKTYYPEDFSFIEKDVFQNLQQDKLFAVEKLLKKE